VFVPYSLQSRVLENWLSPIQDSDGQDGGLSGKTLLKWTILAKFWRDSAGQCNWLVREKLY